MHSLCVPLSPFESLCVPISPFMPLYTSLQAFTCFYTLYKLSSSQDLVVGLVLFSAICGNLLTLVALPYMRSKYKQKYSVLRLNCVILILHLSFCDLLYVLLSFPHFIHAHIYKTNIYSEEVCYFLGMFRNLVACTDYNNVALIACCLARQFLCR